ncbi:hypothetical protein TIFTF001_016531 [Ficus carica]|uniref:Uncharacterized protein n=1 Tax=Ficus carica TaxID=3494 RepID=A0AA88A906_FICCA|nr:hypothetical protein TIFTF001_016531 [Ficus carica]
MCVVGFVAGYSVNDGFRGRDWREELQRRVEGKRERERRERELVVESRLAEMKGDRERERPEREWRRGRRENGRRGHGGGDGF